MSLRPWGSRRGSRRRPLLVATDSGHRVGECVEPVTVEIQRDSDVVAGDRRRELWLSRRQRRALGFCDPNVAENGSRLVSAHRLALEGQSFVLRRERVVRAPNGSVLRKDRIRGRVAADRTRYALSEEHWERDRQWVTTRYWSAGADRPVVQVREDSGPAGYVEYVDETGRPLRVSEYSTGTLPSGRDWFAF